MECHSLLRTQITKSASSATIFNCLSGQRDEATLTLKLLITLYSLKAKVISVISKVKVEDKRQRNKPALVLKYIQPLSLIWSHSKKKGNAASLDTYKEQCLQNPLIFAPAIQYVFTFTLPNDKVFSHSLLILFFRPLPLIVTSHQRRKLQLLHFTNC